MARPASLKPLPNGNYPRQLGYLPSGTQPRFMLGTDRAEALVRNAKLERLWARVKQRAEQLYLDPTWDDVTHGMARAIAAGETRFVIPPNPEMADAESHLHWVGRYVTAYGDILTVVPSDPARYAAGGRFAEEARRAFLLESVRDANIMYPVPGGEPAKLPTGQTTHQALAAYREAMRAEHAEGGTVTQWGERLSDQIDYLARHIPDSDLADFGLASIDGLILTLRNRPASLTRSARGAEPISRSYATAVIKVVHRFVRWLHRSKQFDWRRPEDYEVVPVRLKRSERERANVVSAAQVETYTVEQLATLWRYATPFDRLLMGLALNCGFGQAELATLQQAEIRFHAVHPHAKVLGLTSTTADNWVMRLRSKTEVYGEWRLWGVVVAGLRWYLERRPVSASPYLLVNSKGKAFTEPSKGNNRNSQIPNAWARLIERVRTDHPAFPALSFNKLRKSGQNLLRMEHGGEIASVYATHGKPSPTDELLEVYTNKPFAKMHGALTELETRLQPMWDSVSVPFPADSSSRQKGGANIGLAVIDRIRELRAAGKRISEIVEEVGVSRATVERWVNRP